MSWNKERNSVIIFLNSREFCILFQKLFHSRSQYSFSTPVVKGLIHFDKHFWNRNSRKKLLETTKFHFWRQIFINQHTRSKVNQNLSWAQLAQWLVARLVRYTCEFDPSCAQLRLYFTLSQRVWLSRDSTFPKPKKYYA